MFAFSVAGSVQFGIAHSVYPLASVISEVYSHCPVTVGYGNAKKRPSEEGRTQNVSGPWYETDASGKLDLRRCSGASSLSLLPLFLMQQSSRGCLQSCAVRPLLDHLSRSPLKKHASGGIVPYPSAEVLCARRMAGKADAIRKPAGELASGVEPLEDIHPGRDVGLAVEEFEHLMAAGEEVALAPVRARVEAVGEGVLVTPAERVGAEGAAEHG
jgi:hypothetical protein